MPCPTAPSLEAHFYPNPTQIVKEAYLLIKGTKLENDKLDVVSPEECEFKGPF